MELYNDICEYVTFVEKATGYDPKEDPEFAEKLEAIVGLYVNPPEHAIVLCADEKSQTQALTNLAFADTLFHEIGHHLDHTVGAPAPARMQTYGRYLGASFGAGRSAPEKSLK